MLDLQSPAFYLYISIKSINDFMLNKKKVTYTHML
jgi:hypothetical protein